MVDAVAYHEQTKHSPRSVRESSVSLDPETRPRPYKEYVDLPRIDVSRIRPVTVPALSAIAHSRAEPIDGRTSTLDREALATLCYEATGIIHQGKAIDGWDVQFRAASCTGKLYHVDLYPVVGDVAGVDPGVYHFDPQTCRLDRLRQGDYRQVLSSAVGEGVGGQVDTPNSGQVETRTSDGVDTPVSSAPVTMIATSTWWRNAWKYRDRTYRHAFWDTGTILANLLATAHGMDERASVVTGFVDSAIAELVGVDPAWEAPIALAPIGRGGKPEADERTVSPIDPPTVPVSDYTAYPLVSDAWNQSTLGDARAVVEWRRRLTDGAESGTLGEAEPSRDGVDPETDDVVGLRPASPREQSRRPLAATIRRRRSCRSYDREGPTARQVATVLDRATRGVPGDWNRGGDIGPSFNDVYVLSTGVTGLPDGSYQYHPGGGANGSSDHDRVTLERIGDVTAGETQHLALDQPWAGEAHVNVYLLSNVEAVVSRYGNRGYRVAQLEAGVVLGRLYLATYAHRHLGGTGLTFFDDLVTDHLSPRAASQTPTCLFAFGRAATE